MENLWTTLGSNLLHLPTSLPRGVYTLATSRKTDLSLRIECEQETAFIEQDSRSNIDDIRQYVESKTDRPGIQAYIAAQEIDRELFVEHLVEKSQGSFMYLHYVMPQIERGAYRDLALDTLPPGLTNYYEHH